MAAECTMDFVKWMLPKKIFFSFKPQDREQNLIIQQVYL